MDSNGSGSDWVSGTGAVAAGVGMLMLVLFPLAIPILALTLVVALPLALPLIAVAVIAAILAAAGLGIRAVVRGIRRLWRGPGDSSERRIGGSGAYHRASRGAAASGPRP